MQGCIFIFKKHGCFFLVLLALIFAAAPAFGVDGAGAGAKHEETAGDEILQGPFSEYGEFDSSEDEASDEKFFQFGRFFGLGLGLGFTGATGNASRIYQGGFPTVDARLAYWFDFNFALQVSVQNSKHNYDILPGDGLTEVNFFRTLFQVKYYIDTRDLSAPITFVGPHLIAGGGMYQRTDNVGSGSADSSSNTVTSQSAFGFNFGAGLELTLKPKKTYLQFEGLMHFVTWGDSNDARFRDVGINDRTGNWLTGTVSLMWTW